MRHVPRVPQAPCSLQLWAQPKSSASPPNTSVKSAKYPFLRARFERLGRCQVTPLRWGLRGEQTTQHLPKNHANEVSNTVTVIISFPSDMFNGPSHLAINHGMFFSIAFFLRVLIYFALSDSGTLPHGAVLTFPILGRRIQQSEARLPKP